MSNELSIWKSETTLSEIQDVYCKDLNPIERKCFMAVGLLTGLNPFMKEIFAIKYDKDKAAQIFIGRDGYRKTAQRQPEYDGHFRDVIREGDKFKVVNCVPEHIYGDKRGKVIGAYFLGFRKDISRPFYVYVDLDEYTTGQSIWIKKPATMILKVAESQGIRMMFQNVFAGTYDEAEKWEDEKNDKPITIIKANTPSAPYTKRASDPKHISQTKVVSNLEKQKLVDENSKNNSDEEKLEAVTTIQDCQEFFLTDMDSFILAESFEELKINFAKSYKRTYAIKDNETCQEMKKMLQEVYEKKKEYFASLEKEKLSSTSAA